MKISASLPELLHVALQGEALPAFVRNPRLRGTLLQAEVDVRELPGLTGAARLGARAVGTVQLDVALAGYADGVAVLALEAHARSMPAHRLAALFAGPIDAALARALAERGLPRGTVSLGDSDGVLAVTVRVQDAIDAAPLPEFLHGLVLDDLALADSHVVAHVTFPGRPA